MHHITDYNILIINNYIFIVTNDQVRPVMTTSPSHSPSVRDELAALRRRGVASQHKMDLEGAVGLSTPEAEEAKIGVAAERRRVGNYGAEAREALREFNGARAGLFASSPSKADAAAAAPALPGGGAGKENGLLPGDGGSEGTEPEGEPRPPPPGPRKEPPNRTEKKARKMMQRLGMRPVSGIGRATFRVTGEGGEYYAIEGPDVYEKGGTYVVFGEARQGGGLQQQAAMQQAKAAQQLQEDTEVPTVSGSAEGGDEGDEAVNESGVEAKDIELVMSQASCSRAKAVTALKENDGDLVNAIMSLTT